MLFDEDYYRRVIAEYGYDPTELRPIDFALGRVDASTLAAKWICHHEGDIFAQGVRSGRPSIVTTGVGMSGVPHVGTISQILKAIFLQKAGLVVQLVLGDLDAYNSRSRSLAFVSELGERYTAFALALGFDAEEGVLRTQRDHLDVLLTAYLTANCLRDADFRATEEELSALYKERLVYPGIEFPVKLSILLMAADFIHLCKTYDHIMVMLGIDEHRYVRLTKTAVDRLAITQHVSAIYSRITKGFAGYPKMSKSLAGSSISVDLPAATIRRMILDEEGAHATPLDSVVYQMMCFTSFYTASELTELYRDCEQGGQIWSQRKAQYADILIDICDKWPK